MWFDVNLYSQLKLIIRELVRDQSNRLQIIQRFAPWAMRRNASEAIHKDKSN